MGMAAARKQEVSLTTVHVKNKKKKKKKWARSQGLTLRVGGMGVSIRVANKVEATNKSCSTEPFTSQLLCVQTAVRSTQ